MRGCSKQTSIGSCLSSKIEGFVTDGNKYILCCKDHTNLLELAHHVKFGHTGLAVNEKLTSSDKASTKYVCSRCHLAKNWCTRREFMIKDKNKHACLTEFERSKDINLFTMSHIVLGLRLARYLLAQYLGMNKTLAEKEYGAYIEWNAEYKDNEPILEIFHLPSMLDDLQVITRGKPELFGHLGMDPSTKIVLAPAPGMSEDFL